MHLLPHASDVELPVRDVIRISPFTAHFRRQPCRLALGADRNAAPKNPTKIDSMGAQ